MNADTSYGCHPRVTQVRTRPSDEVIWEFKRAYNLTRTWDFKFLDYIQGVATHEAAHAVLHHSYGFEIQIAEIPSRKLDGLVVVRRPERSLRNAMALARAMLAGPIADLVAGHHQPRPGNDDPVNGYHDILEARDELGAHAHLLPELWVETVLFITEPRTWRAILAVGIELLRRGVLEGHEIDQIIAKAAKKKVDMDALMAARTHVLALETYRDAIRQSVMRLRLCQQPA